MNKLAYENLKLLDEEHSDTLFLISDHNILSLIEKDSFDTCSKVKSLEYPIYFTYHHILNIVDYDKDISYKNKMNLLEMIKNSLDNLTDYLNDYEEEDNNISDEIIYDIYERYDIVKLNQKHNYFERIIYLFDEMVRALETVIAGGRYLSPRITNVVIDDYIGKNPKGNTSNTPKLTGRERQIVQLLAEGKTVKEIARVLHISPKTADTNRRQIMNKLGVSSIAEVTKYAIREGLTSLEF